MAFIEPVGLTEFTQNGAARREFSTDDLAHFANLGGKTGAGGPVGLDQLLEIEGERRVSAEAREVEIGRGNHPRFDRGLIGAGLGGGEHIEESGKGGRIDFADVLNGAQGPIGALGDFARVVVGAREEVGIGDLPLAHLVGVGRGDTASGGSARFFFEHVDAVVLPREVEQAVNEVGHHGALIDRKAADDGVAFMLERGGFPPDFARIRHDAAADGEVRDIFFNDAGRQQVEFHASRGVAGIGATVDLQHG